MYLQSKLNSGFALLFSFFIFFYITNASTNEKDYFLTLKNNKVNVRQGPSFDYPIKFIIKKKYLPVKIIDSYDNFKKVIDIKSRAEKEKSRVSEGSSVRALRSLPTLIFLMGI